MRGDRELLAIMAGLVVLSLVPQILRGPPEDLEAVVVEQTDQVDTDAPDPELEETKVTILDADPGSYKVDGKPAATGRPEELAEGLEA